MLIVVAVAGTAVALARIDTISRHAVEDWGTEALGTRVQLAEAHVSVFKGKVALKGLRVANPLAPAFPTADFLSVGGISGEADVMRVIRGGDLHVRELRIESPQFFYDEIKGVSNIEAIRRCMAQSARAGAEGGASAATVRLRIDMLRIRNAAIHIRRDGREIAAFSAAEIEIPSLCDQNGGGLPSDRVVGAIIERVFCSAVLPKVDPPRQTPPKRNEPRHGR